MAGTDRTAGGHRRTYHHGDLRRALIEAALDVVAESGQGTLSLRALAGRVGVSPTAVYRHFADLDTLLAAAAAEAFRRFSVAMRAVPIGPEASFEDLGWAYLRFARDHPGLYGLIFGAAHFGTSEDPDLRAAASDAFASLVEAVARQLPEDRREEAAGRAVVIWSAIHGVADLTGKGLLPSGDGPDRNEASPALEGLVQVMARVARGA